MYLMEESLLCLTGETKADVIYEKSSRSMSACWRSISRRTEVCSMSSWTLVVSALWENGFCDAVLQHHPQSSSLGHLLEPIASPSSSLIFTCSGFIFQRKPMEHPLCAVGTASGARGWRAVRRLHLSLQKSLPWTKLHKWENHKRKSTLSSPQVPQVIGNVGMELKVWSLVADLLVLESGSSGPVGGW